MTSPQGRGRAALCAVRLTLRRDDAVRTVTIDVTQQLPGSVSFGYPCRFGVARNASADGRPLPVAGQDVQLPAGFRQAVIGY